jgi:hypothetical protein
LTEGRLYVVGGRQRRGRPLWADDREWYEYEAGLVLEVDPASGRARVVLEYESPEAARALGGATLFKSATLEGGRLYACTQTELLVYRVPDFELVHYLSLPCFNDVHHARPTPDGALLVAVAGLDLVLELSMSGEVLREWDVLGEDSRAKFPRGLDYRARSTKPHRAHPNHVFYLGDEAWATRYYQRDAVSLTRPGRRIAIGGEAPHDGLVAGGRVHFTAVDGRVAVADAATLEVERAVDLNALEGRGASLGWCRGLLVQGDEAWVGFSRFRPTRLRQNVQWVRRGFRRPRPTRLARYDLVRGRLLGELDLEPHGLDVLFSILPTAPPDGPPDGP